MQERRRRCSCQPAVRVQWREESLQGGHRSIGLPRTLGLRQTVRDHETARLGFTPSPTWLPHHLDVSWRPSGSWMHDCQATTPPRRCA